MLDFLRGFFFAIFAAFVAFCILIAAVILLPSATNWLAEYFEITIDRAWILTTGSLVVFIISLGAIFFPITSKDLLLTTKDLLERSTLPFLPLIGEAATLRSPQQREDAINRVISMEVSDQLDTEIASKAQAKVSQILDEELFKLSESDRMALVERATSKITETISEETLEAFKESQARTEIKTFSEKAQTRLYSQVEYLEQRASRTLAVGISFCTLGLFFLFTMSVFEGFNFRTASEENSSWAQYIQVQVPRISLLLVIELIGFFFLKLYVRTLSELRFTHNELTNIEAKLIALQASQSSKIESAVLSSISALSSTERNAILTKGQTTIEIEKERANNEANRDLIASISQFLHGSDKSSMWTILGKR